MAPRNFPTEKITERGRKKAQKKEITQIKRNRVNYRKVIFHTDTSFKMQLNAEKRSMTYNFYYTKGRLVKISYSPFEHFKFKRRTVTGR